MYLYIYIYLWIIRVGGAVKYSTYVRKRAVFPARKVYIKAALCMTLKLYDKSEIVYANIGISDVWDDCDVYDVCDACNVSEI